MAQEATGGADARASSSSAMLHGMAAAASWLSAASFMGLAGVIYLLGYDALAYGLGWTAGFVLLGVLIAPRLAASGATSAPVFFARRYGEAAHAFGAIVMGLVFATLLAAEIGAAALIGARFGLGFWISLAAFSALAALGAVTMGRRGSIAPPAALYLILIVAYLAPAVLMSLKAYGNPIPPLAYGQALQDIAALEQTFIAQRLADVRSLKSMTQPFVAYDALNFFGLILCLTAGLAATPFVLTRGAPREGSGHIRHAAAWALFFVFLLYVTAPAYAAFAKLAIYQGMIGKPLASLPDWVYVWGSVADPERPGQGLVMICGKAATDAQAVLAACGSGHPGALRLQDFAILPSALILAVPDIAGLPFGFSLLIAAGAFAAVLGAAAQILWLSAASETPDGRAVFSFLNLESAAVFAGLAPALALLKPGDLVTLTAWACSLAAAGLFPALLLGLTWRLANAWGAAAGIALGGAITLYYIAATRYFAVAFYETWGAVSNASAIAAQKFAVLKGAWTRAAEGPAKDAAWTALDAHAQTIANWWGVKNIAAGVFGLPLGLLAVILVSAVFAASPAHRQP